MGGLIATRYTQRHREDLAGPVLRGPAVGLGPVVEGRLAAPELRSNAMIDPAVLSRDRVVGEAYVTDPLVYLHGGDDQLPPVALVVERVAGPDSEPRILEAARHELFNELSKTQTIKSVASFAERVTAS